MQENLYLLFKFSLLYVRQKKVKFVKRKYLFIIHLIAILLLSMICGSYVFYVKKIKYKNTNIIRIEEGIGNQLYQYAFGYLLEKKYGMKVLYQNNINENDARVWVRYGLDKFNINVKLFEPNFIEKFIIGKKKDINNLLLKDKILYAKNHDFKSFYLTYFDASLLEGYEKDFQDMFLTLSPKYKNELDDKNKAMIKEMQSHKNSVVVNIRLGDFLYHPELNICNFDYYKKAMKVFENMEDVHYYIFSDDIEGAKKYFRPNKPHTYVDVNPLEKPYLNLILSASGKHNIISNSTFAMWAAILNRNPNKIVVCPNEYVRLNNQNMVLEGERAYPKNWIRIDTTKDKPISAKEVDTELTGDMQKIKMEKQKNGAWTAVKK